MRLRYARGIRIGREKDSGRLEKALLDLGKAFEVLSAHLRSHRELL